MTDTHAQAGRVLMLGFDGPRLGDETRERLRRIAPGAVILFDRNLETAEQLSELVGQLRDALPDPALLALDQEGGRVSRLRPWIGATPTAASLARAGGRAAYRFGRATGAALRSLGFNVDFAPVVDLCREDAKNGIGDRSFGTDAEQVVGLAGSFLDGLQGEGVAGCLKHFPGLGDTQVDSHQALPVCKRELDRLESEDLLPYERLGSRAACVMVAHATYPALDPESRTPASLSATIVDRLLRGHLGFRGLVVSDGMEMGAVAPLDREGSAAVAAIGAGCDLVPYCSDLERAERARDALARAADSDPAFGERLRSAARTLTQTAARWPAPRPDLEAWERAAQELRDAASIS